MSPWVCMGFKVAVSDAAQANEVALQIDQRLGNSSTPTLTIPDRVNEIYAVNSGISGHCLHTCAGEGWVSGGSPRLAAVCPGQKARSIEVIQNGWSGQVASRIAARPRKRPEASVGTPLDPCENRELR